jgi:hypothetical protein
MSVSGKIVDSRCHGRRGRRLVSWPRFSIFACLHSVLLRAAIATMRNSVAAERDSRRGRIESFRLNLSVFATGVGSWRRPAYNPPVPCRRPGSPSPSPLNSSPMLPIRVPPGTDRSSVERCRAACHSDAHPCGRVGRQSSPFQITAGLWRGRTGFVASAAPVSAAAPVSPAARHGCKAFAGVRHPRNSAGVRGNRELLSAVEIAEILKDIANLLVPLMSPGHSATTAAGLTFLYVGPEGPDHKLLRSQLLPLSVRRCRWSVGRRRRRRRASHVSCIGPVGPLPKNARRICPLQPLDRRRDRARREPRPLIPVRGAASRLDDPLSAGSARLDPKGPASQGQPAERPFARAGLDLLRLVVSSDQGDCAPLGRPALGGPDARFPCSSARSRQMETYRLPSAAS